MRRTLSALIITLAAILSPPTQAGILKRGQVQLICHRTANRNIGKAKP